MSPTTLTLLPCTYHEICLGYVVRAMAKGTRWLTHREISEGCIRALHSGAPRTVVGTLEPWKSHPTY
jgi:hypothetical protein